MSSTIKLFQGADRTITVTSDKDLTTATEVEVRIDTPKQIIKTKTGGGVTNIIATGFDILIEDGDTTDIASGEYRIQARSTASTGIITHAQLAPSAVTVADSIFTTIS